MTMEVLCARCGDEFITEVRIRIKRDWRSDSEERAEVPTETLCPSCRGENDEEIEAEEITEDD